LMYSYEQVSLHIQCHKYPNGSANLAA
jgi:hypothetical protein